MTDGDDAKLDVADLRQLVKEPSATNRTAAAERVGNLFAGGALSDRERDIALDIPQLLARDVELLVRRAVVGCLQASPNVPRELALQIAADVDSVSTPLLQFSPVLSEQDLLDIIDDGDTAKQIAIASRAGLPESASTAIAETGAATAVVALLKNASAAIPAAALETALDRHGTIEQVQSAMAERKELPLVVAERLVSLASDSIRKFVASRHALPPDVVAEIMLDARERATLEVARRPRTQEEIAALAQSLHERGRLTETLILSAFCVGDLDFAEYALAARAQIPVANVHRLLLDPSGVQRLMERCGLSAACLAVGRAAIAILDDLRLSGATDDRELCATLTLERMLTQFEQGVPGEVTPYLLRTLRRLTPERRDAAPAVSA